MGWSRWTKPKSRWAKFLSQVLNIALNCSIQGLISFPLLHAKVKEKHNHRLLIASTFRWVGDGGRYFNIKGKVQLYSMWAKNIYAMQAKRGKQTRNQDLKLSPPNAQRAIKKRQPRKKSLGWRIQTREAWKAEAPLPNTISRQGIHFLISTVGLWPSDAELILEYDFEVAEAYLEWIEHHKKVHKHLIKN